ncbi:MAG: bifunctional precorrin-2 dehydrogenase/sirohydrochlorin ferrochelatase [Acidobacteria bacterium]|nr:bifunctional precorrin-2 dehydrogenase/sirohydrochlorin ferrochelatase [Acidobacteriota bacterium]
MKVYYPIFVDLTSKPVIVVGAGKVGMRKSRGLAEAGASVTVVSPDAAEPMPEGVRWLRRGFQPGDLKGAFLVFTAANEKAVNDQVRDEAAALGIPCNSADDADLCDFIVPARLRHDDLQIAVSTGGQNPGRAAAVRDRIREFLSKQGI